jgi:hypothetical protein
MKRKPVLLSLILVLIVLNMGVLDTKNTANFVIEPELIQTSIEAQVPTW